MFTGIVQQVGALEQREAHEDDQSLAFTVSADWLAGTRKGDSLAVNGVCLTVTRLWHAGFAADVSTETLRRSTLGLLDPGAPVNLEKALTAADPLGGHIVSGHVDATAKILQIEADARSRRLWISLPGEMARLVAPKGNICVDGASLTVNEVSGQRFGVNMVPFTLDATIANSYKVDTMVNLEADIIARYVARILGGDRATED